MEKIQVEKASGKLGILVVGLGGAVSTTFIVGTLAARKGLAKPIGSITQMSYLTVGKKESRREELIRDIVPLSAMDDLVFGGWDIFPESVYEGAMHAQVLSEKDINLVAEEAHSIRPMKACFDPKYVTRLHGTWVKEPATKWEWAQQLRQDIRDFKAANGCDRLVVLWSASTEIYMPESDVHRSLEVFEAAMKADSEEIAPSMCYAYAALMEGVPFINGAPALTIDFPAIWELAEKNCVPIGGKDYKYKGGHYYDKEV